MSVVCVIPARFHSTRFPGKLLQKASGKTVLERTFEKAAGCSLIDHLFVATDHEKIKEHVVSFGGNVIWTSESCQNGTERICDALISTPLLQNASLILNVQGDHPCTEPATLEAIIQALQGDPVAVMATAVTKIETREEYLSPHTVKCVFDKDFNALYFSRSPIPYHVQNQPMQSYAHIGVYCYRTPFLKKFLDQKSSFLQKSEDLEQLKVLENGHRIKIAVVQEKILGIDTPQDLEKLKEML